jgi:hypothetical protein
MSKEQQAQIKELTERADAHTRVIDSLNNDLSFFS